jgi:hypothetical protein
LISAFVENSKKAEIRQISIDRVISTDVEIVNFIEISCWNISRDLEGAKRASMAKNGAPERYPHLSRRYPVDKECDALDGR